MIAMMRSFTPDLLGSATFRERYGLRYAYVCGAMYQGVASAALVIRAGRAGMLAFLGAGGLPPERLERELTTIAEALGDRQPWGVNLLCNLDHPEREAATVALCLKHGVRVVEAAAFMTITPALAHWRASGLTRGSDGRIHCGHRVIAKLSRPEIAEHFLSPIPERVLNKLVQQGTITAEQAVLAALVPVADDLTVEADSAGHTDRGIAYTLIPAIVRLRDRLATQLPNAEPVHVGSGGGLGTPEAMLAALTLGADFLVTGSVNQCTVEAGTSDVVKDLLAGLQVQDTDYAPAGDMFELGARVQVAKRGLLFPARANKLYELYRRLGSLDELDARTREQLEREVFRKPLTAVWSEVRERLAVRDPTRLVKIERDAKQRMALVFRWYFGLSSRAALAGDLDRKVDFQIHCGPAMGACNQWLVGSGLEDWRRRHVDELGVRLLTATSDLLGERLKHFSALANPDHLITSGVGR